MKKYIIGIIIGAVLMFSGQAVAETISKIGKKIVAEYPVVVDGKMLKAKAVSVDGVSNTPNRALADAIGYDVTFYNDIVYFNKKTQEGGVVMSETVVNDPAVTGVNIEGIDFQIESLKGLIELAQTSISGGYVTTDEARIKTENKIKELQDKIQALETQKAELLAK